MVVRNLGTQVMGNVSLSNTVKEETVNAAVNGAKGSALKVERALAVVG